MKAVILAGGLGTRLAEETGSKPKPMIEIGGKPMLWHIMKIYSYYGVSDFIICCGYKGYIIKEYFANYFLHMSDVKFDIRSNSVEIIQKRAEPWSVTLVDTGEDTMTGGRLLRVKEYLENEQQFCLTYGDGVADVNIKALVDFHGNHGRLATLTAALPPARFGALEIDNGLVRTFVEKPLGDGGLINGGFFVLSPNVFNLLKDDKTVWEQEPLQTLATNNQLMAYEHRGFWQPMDTLRDKTYLDALWSNGEAPWKIW